MIRKGSLTRSIGPKKQHREREPHVVFGMSFFGYDASRFSMVYKYLM